MTLHDSARSSRGLTWGTRWRLVWRGLRRWPVLCRRERWLRRRRSQRTLSAIEGILAAESPALASMFDTFNQLAEGERPASTEGLAPTAWPRPYRVHIAVLLALAAIATLCLSLSVRIHPSTRDCLVTTAAGTTAYSPVRVLSCPAYATTNK